MEGEAGPRPGQLAHREAGTGDAIVLLHGNPTSSHLWRAVLPVVARHGRAIAPDLLGMGDSPRLPDPGPGSYRFRDHRDALAAFLDAADIGDRVVLVGHDWGGALAFDWARRHPGRVRGLAFMETIVRPRRLADEDPDGQVFFTALRGPAGEDMVLRENVFVEQVLAGATRDLDPTDLEVYRAPFREPGEARRPMLAWAREIPFDGEPADVHAIVADYARWLAESSVPKLFVEADPGAIMTEELRAWCRDLPNVTVTTVGPSGHFVPEDAGTAVAAALDTWLAVLA